MSSPLPHPAPAAATSSAHLGVDGLSFSYPDRRVLTDVSFTVPAGRVTGLIGENGSGKSTLLRIIAGDLTPDTGTARVSLPGADDIAIGLLRQEVTFDPHHTVTQVLEDAVTHLREAERQVAVCAASLAEDPQDDAAAAAYDAALARAERWQAWQVEPRIERTVAGLGLADLDRDRATGALSGGQRSRLALAALVLSAPDVLLLDEPTNHLDDAAAEHLAGVLREWPGPVLLASHDRAFLDDSVGALVDLDPSASPARDRDPAAEAVAARGVTRFSGTYTDYLAHRSDARERWERRFRDEQAELRQLREQVRDSHQVGNPDRGPRTEARASKKFYADRNAAVVSRRVNDARQRLERLEEAQVRKPPEPLTFAGFGRARAASTGGVAMTASEVAVEGRLAPVSCVVPRSGRLLVTGPNGVGKSTLLRLLVGEVEATSGSAWVAPGLTVGLLRQESRVPDPRGQGGGRTAGEAYVEGVGPVIADRTPLGGFGLLHPRDETRALDALSVGTVRRLELAILLARSPDVLLLDEPTNHLSLGLVTELEAALPDYDGAVIIASHDRWLRRGWTGETLDLTGPHHAGRAVPPGRTTA